MCDVELKKGKDQTPTICNLFDKIRNSMVKCHICLNITRVYLNRLFSKKNEDDFSGKVIIHESTSGVI
jgi:hypothetical protein